MPTEKTQITAEDKLSQRIAQVESKLQKKEDYEYLACKLQASKLPPKIQKLIESTVQNASLTKKEIDEFIAYNQKIIEDMPAEQPITKGTLRAALSKILTGQEDFQEDPLLDMGKTGLTDPYDLEAKQIDQALEVLMSLLYPTTDIELKEVTELIMQAHPEIIIDPDIQVTTKVGVFPKLDWDRVRSIISEVTHAAKDALRVEALACIKEHKPVIHGDFALPPDICVKNLRVKAMDRIKTFIRRPP